MSDTPPPHDDWEPGFNTGAVLGFLIGFICCAAIEKVTTWARARFGAR